MRIDVPHKGDLAPISLQERIDSICDDFEREWLSGKAPRIDDYLKRLPGDYSVALFRELAALDVHYRRKQGEEVTIDFLTEQYPEYSRAIPRKIKQDATRGVAHSGKLPLPARITHFELLDILGEGGFGTVYRARDIELNRMVAVKLARALIGDATISRFLREGRHVAQLSHPGIVAVYSVGRCEHGPFIVSEYVPGPTLAEQLCESGPANDETTAKIVVQLADAMEYAHTCGVIHRDLKPSNVILARDSSLSVDIRDRQTACHYVPRILDFGLARSADADASLTADGVVLGTPSYMSPEQARGEAHLADARSDVYSLGIILYELLSGAPPVTGEKREVVERVARGEIPQIRQRRRDVPKDLVVIVHHCLESDPDRRYQRAGQLSADLRRWLAGEPIQARATSLAERTWRWAQRHRQGCVVAAAILSMVGILTASLMWVSKGLANARGSVAQQLIDRLQVAPPEEVPDVLSRIETHPEAKKRIRVLLQSKQLSARERARLLLASRSLSSDDYVSIVQWMLEASPEELLLICNQLRPLYQDILVCVREILHSSELTPNPQWLRSASILAQYASPETVTHEFLTRFAAHVVDATGADAHTWAKIIEPLEKDLAPYLVDLFLTGESASARRSACELLVELRGEQPQELIKLLPDTDPLQHRIVVEGLRNCKDSAIPLLKQTVQRDIAVEGDPVATESAARGRAYAALALVALGRAEAAWELLKFSPDPRAQAYFIDRAHQAATPVEPLIGRLMKEPDSHAQYVLMVTLGQYDKAVIPVTLQQRLDTYLQEAYRSNPDAGVHSAANWLLRRRGLREWVRITDQQLMLEKPTPERNWYINSVGMQMIIVRSPQPFLMGASPDENSPHEYENQQERFIPWTYAISATEVTWRDFQKYDVGRQRDRSRAPEVECPVDTVDFHDAIAYCEWLTAHELGEAEQNAIVHADGDALQINLRNGGYRLPSSTEWELACRAGTTTSRFFGSQLTPLADNYIWWSTSRNHSIQVATKAPNSWGLHDCYGNVHEWVATARTQVPFPPIEPSTIKLELRHGIFNRGGAYDWREAVFRSASATPAAATLRRPELGFRIARTMVTSASGP